MWWNTVQFWSILKTVMRVYQLINEIALIIIYCLFYSLIYLLIICIFYQNPISRCYCTVLYVSANCPVIQFINVYFSLHSSFYKDDIHQWKMGIAKLLSKSIEIILIIEKLKGRNPVSVWALRYPNMLVITLFLFPSVFFPHKSKNL